MEAETAVENPDASRSVPPDASKDKKKVMQQVQAANVPKDFAARVATKIITINERELDDVVAAERVAALVNRNMNADEMYVYFVEAMEILLSNEETLKYAATTWTALLWHAEDHPEYKVMVDHLIDTMLMGHLTGDRPQWESEETGKIFSFYAYVLGEVFIQMMRMNSDLYEYLTDIFGLVIRKEMAFNLELKEKESRAKKNIAGKKKEPKIKVVATKKLYDDVVDYVSSRGDFRSDTLNQKNPNEYINLLADRMRSTRRYIIQDIMNREALNKKKKLEKELKEREASAEEVISIGESFNHGLYLYWVEKRYNFKYLAVEKVRVTLEVLGMTSGVMMIGLGVLNIGTLTILEGGVVCAMMMIFSRFLCSRQFFAPFFPRDVTAELEKDVGVYTPIFRKMSKTQMNAFMTRHLRDTENGMLLHLMAEYVKYIFAVMPERNDLLMSNEDVTEFIEHLEANISKQQRAR